MRGIILLLMLLTPACLATTAPTKEQVLKYKKKGMVEELASRAKVLGNQKLDKSLIYKLNPSMLSAANKGQQEFQQDFPSVGAPKILTLLIDFNDHPHNPTFDVSSYQENIFGSGQENTAPFFSLTDYYKKASYNKLDIQGNVLDWYRHNGDRPLDDGNRSSTSQLIKAALEYHDNKGHDFSQYDNDGDGYIDYIAVLWTGPLGDWATLWWGTFYSWFDDENFEIDGKKINSFSWQQAYRFNGVEDSFDVYTLVHETGHAMGLPDYYDYTFKTGGVGNTDVMDGGWTDFSAFSKYLLGWIEPTVVGSDELYANLYPSGVNDDALLLMPNANESSKFEEFFIAQYRTKNSNDSELFGEGLFVYHIDATIDEWGHFVNNNSYSENKLIKLVQADGLHELEGEGSSYATIEDLFLSGSEFSPLSTPSSVNNADKHTGVVITNIEIEESSVALLAEIRTNIPNFSVDNLSDRTLIRDGHTFVIQPDGDNIKSIELLVDGEKIQSKNKAPFNFSWQSNIAPLGAVNLVIKAINQEGGSSSRSFNIFNKPKGKSALFVNLSKHPNDGNPQLKKLLHRAGIIVTTSPFLFEFEANDFELLFVNYGTQSGLWEKSEDGGLSASGYSVRVYTSEVDIYSSLLSKGVNIVIEGENVFTGGSYGVNDTFRELFGTTTAEDNLSSLKQIVDINSNALSEILSFPNVEGGEVTPLLDILKPKLNVISSQVALKGVGQVYNYDNNTWGDLEADCGLFNEMPTSKVFVSSCMLRHMSNEGLSTVFNRYFDFISFDKQLSAEPFVTDYDSSGDGYADILWRNNNHGQNWHWHMQGLSLLSANKINQVSLDWRIVGRGDFNGDSKADILWRNQVSGKNWIYLMDGDTILESKMLNTIADSHWEIKSVLDLNGDSKDDILWHHQTHGYTWAYIMNGIGIAESKGIKTVKDTDWQVVANGDINGDGYSDVVWRHKTHGWNYVWLMEGISITKQYMLNTVPTEWEVVGAGDINGDNIDDILWRHKQDGRNWAYLMENGEIKVSQQINTISDPNWQVVTIADFDADGKADIFWHHQTTGQTYLYLMNGLIIKSKAWLDTIDPSWSVIKP